MTGVALRRFAAVLAAAEINRLCLHSLEFHGGELTTLMTAVAEGLLCAFAAGTPEVALTCFDRYGKRCFLKNGWSGHLVDSEGLSV